MPLKKYLDYDGLDYLIQRIPRTKIKVTFDDVFAGETATCSMGTTTYTKTVPATEPYELVFPINELGTWSIATSYLGDDYGTTIEVTAIGQTATGHVSYVTDIDGSTVEPTDDITTWLKCANITDKSYTTLAEVLADRETFETLIANSNACDYMARSTTWAGGLGLIPEMTGYNSPSGTVSLSGEYDSSGLGWYAFDGWDKNSMTSWGANGLSNKWIQYKFDTAQIAKRAYIQTFDSGNGVRIKNFKILASNDNFSSDSNELYSGIFDQNTTERFVTFENDTAYEYYRLYIIDAYPSSSAIINVVTFQLYPDLGGISGNKDAMSLLGKYDYACNKLLRNSIWSASLSNSRYFEYVLNASVPKMTSATAPNGEVFASTTPWSNSSWFWLFNGDLTSGDNSGTGSPTTDSWVAYDFVEDVIINKVSFMNETQTPVYIGDFIIESSDDNVTWTEEASGTNINKTSGLWWHFVVENPSGAHRYWRFHNLTNGGGQQNTGWSLQELQFYGRKSNEVLVPLVPAMTSATTPSGEVITSGSPSDYEAWKAFDNNDTTEGSVSAGVDGYIGYRFANPTCVNAFRIYDNNTKRLLTFKIQASNTGGTNDWIDISDVMTMPSSYDYTAELRKNGILNTESYYYYRVLQVTTSFSVNIEYKTIQFYAKTVQTNIIHSTPNDTIYMMENGSPVVLTTTNSDGDGILDFSQFMDGTYTLYSSVAKDPDNLSNDFSKSIRITKTSYGCTTEAYLMPSKTLYWYGYEEIPTNVYDDIPGYGGISKNTNYTAMAPTYQNVGSTAVEEPQNVNAGLKVCGILSYSPNTYGGACVFGTFSAKNPTRNNANANAVDTVTVSSAGLQKVEKVLATSGNYYVKVVLGTGTNSQSGNASAAVYALWCE